MFKFIAIIDRSHIIREGLTALLRDNNLCQRVGSLEHPDEWLPAFRDTEPDLVIVNPDLWQKGNNKRWGSEKTIVVGLIYQYYEKEILAQFDETIYITDSGETIVKKLSHLQKHSKSLAIQSLSAREKRRLETIVARTVQQGSGDQTRHQRTYGDYPSQKHHRKDRYSLIAGLSRICHTE
ncbi:hypothetical protein FACS1894201_11440 [Bacteroidia bacterium]|nr:hypothetical protein FACS1894201_11440 [Bacteroidia bacterium]